MKMEALQSVCKHSRVASVRGLVWLFCLLLTMTSCGSADDVESRPPLLLIIGSDGLRHDYVTKQRMPQLYDIAQQGVWASEGMTPVFPSKTIPNFYAIATGLYAESHGIVANTFYDPERNEYFNYFSDNKTMKQYSMNGDWYSGTPIWLLNEQKPGHRSGCFHWPLCDAGIGGKTMTHAVHFKSVHGNFSTWTKNLNTVLDWFRQPDQAINLGLLYIPEPDETAHRNDVEGQAVLARLVELDRFTGHVVKVLEEDPELKGRMNVVFLSDHGFANLKVPDSYLDLQKYIPQEIWDQFAWNLFSFLPLPDAQPGIAEELFKNMTEWKRRDGWNMSVWRKEEIPERFHWRNNPRIGPVALVPDLGYYAVYNLSSPWYENKSIRGQHGYDNHAHEMRSTFVAHGPGFKSGAVVPLFENVNLYSMFARVLDISPPATNGSLKVLGPYLVNYVPADDDQLNSNSTSFQDKVYKMALRIWKKTGTGGSLVVIFAVILPTLSLVLYFCVVFHTSRRRVASMLVKSTAAESADAASGGGGKTARQPLLAVNSSEEEDTIM